MTGAAVEVTVGDPLAPDLVALLDEHLAEMQATSPPCSVHALPSTAFVDPALTVFVARENGELLGCGALKTHDDGLVELKAMRTRAVARGRGVGQAVLSALLAEAERRGASWARLETGVEDHFAPARRLYERAGFVRCGPFADYTDDPNSVYYELALPRG